MIGKQNICGIVCCINTGDTWKHCTGVFENCFQCNPEITRDMNLSQSPNRLTNVLESGDNRGLLSNNAWTNTLYKYQHCDDVAEVKHMRYKHPKRH